MRRTTDTLPAAPEFSQVVELLALYSDADSRLKEIEAETNGQLLELIDDKKAEYAKLQAAMTQAETALEILCRSHPAWFMAAKSIKTPYGKVLFHSSTTIEVGNPEATCKLLHAEGRANPLFKSADYLRAVEEPNVEALEALPDAELERFMVRRVKKDNFSVTPAKVDFGKAVKEAAEKAG